jgi:phosphate starvation-inducible PhoH-like protein
MSRKNKKLPEHAIEEINDYNDRSQAMRKQNDIIVVKKLDFELTAKQKELMKIIDKNKIVTITGPPGTSKSFSALYNAVQTLLRGDVEKIIISKPTEILSGTSAIGHLPGTLDEKMLVYIESFLDCFFDILRPEHFKHLWESKIIEFKPAQFLRGRTLKNSFIIIDEFQNFDIQTLKSIVTRLGKNSKMLFMGDTKQNDINKRYVAVDKFKEILSTVNGCAAFEFERKDIVREQILIDIIDRFEYFDDRNELPNTIKGA